MSKANQVSGTLTGAPGAGALRRWIPCVLLALVLAAAAWFALDFPTFVQAEGETPLWSADLSVVELENGAIGAVRAGDFSNQGGSAGLTAKWLYYYPPERKLRLSFSDGASVKGHVLQVGDFSVAFTENDSGNNSFTWDDVDVDWENGQTLAARIVPGSDGDIPATGAPTVSGRAQVDETLSADTSDIADEDGLDSATFSYQWQSDGADIELATGSSYTPVAADLGKTIRVKVSFTDDEGNSESLTSKPTGAVIAANTPATGEPTISGTPQVRQTLTAGVSTIADQDGITAVSYTYRWLADDVDIEGATGASYRLASAEIGKTIKVMVSFSDDAGNEETLTSAATDTVADGPPDPPTISSAQRRHIGMLRVDWDDMADATAYEIEYHQYDIEWLQLPHAPLNYDAHFNGSEATIDGLADQATYTFRVRAVNGFGGSDWSETYTSGFSASFGHGPTSDPRPRLSGSPSKPRELRASAGRHLEIGLSWTGPEETGDSAISGYRIEFQSADSEIWNYLGTTTETSYVHTGLSPGRTFYYRVSAFNEHGRGQNSARARGASTAHSDQSRWEPAVHEVAADWELLPGGVDWKAGDRFRLMFITSESRGANSANIADYNQFVQDAAAAGHSDIQEYSSDFRVLASTVAADARDNTGTNWSDDAPGVPVYWLEGTRVADDYPDLYDGEWDDPRFIAEVRPVFSRHYDRDQGWVTTQYSRTFYEFDAAGGEYTYTDEHGASMYGRHCHGYNWQSLDPNGDLDDNNIDTLPCIATGSNNDGTVHYSEHLSRCGFHNSLGGGCGKVAFGRPTRILPEEAGVGRPTVDVDPTLHFAWRKTRPAYVATEREGSTDRSIELTNISEGRISLTFLFYAMSPIFEIETKPSLSVADGEATGGDDATLDFVVTLDPAATEEVAVDYATQDGTATAGSDYTTTSGTLTFAAGETSKTVSVPIADQTVEDGGKTFKLTLSNASGGEIADSEATGTIGSTEANTAAAGLPTIGGTPQVGVTLTADTSNIDDEDGLDDVSYRYQWIANDGNSDADIEEATASTYTPSVSDVGQTIKVKVSFTDDAENDETLTSAATEAVAATVPTAPLSLTVAAGEENQELDASWQAPSSNGGSDVTGYKVQWQEAADSWDTAADVSEATVTGTTHTITSLTGGVEYAVRVIATNVAGDGPASTEAKGTPAAENTAPTGLPTIDGTPQVEQTLTADTSNIDDADGLDDVSYRYQWIAGGTDIDGATGASYTLTTGQQGETMQVRVDFEDDEGNSESLTSVATVAVAAKPDPLTVSVTAAAPATHDGSSEFTLDIEFSEEFGLSYRTLKFHAFSVTGGSVERAQRTDKPSNISWRIAVKPHGTGDVVIQLPATTDCGAQGAICTGDGRMLSNSLNITVSGPEP